MALATTNLALTTVRTALGYTADYHLFGIGTSILINRWSKYKPVRAQGNGITVHERGKDDAGYWGFNFSGSNPDKWDYLQPRGGSWGGSPDEPVRLGDFRGYEHDRTLAYPAIQCRDTDNNANYDFNHADSTILYPSGSGTHHFLNRWYCRAYRTTSSVIIIPSTIDIGAVNLDNFYVGIKVSAGSVWYKTFGQVFDLTFAKSWNISISVEIQNWTTTPSFSNFPYYIGLVDWQLFLSSSAAAAWTASSPGVIIYFTGIAKGGSPDTWDTDGTNKYITSGQFTIHDWIKLSSYSKTFDGTGNPYQGSTVYCSTANTPAFTKSATAWINTAVYDGETLISNPALYLSGMTIRITCNPLTTACIVSPVVAVGQDWSLDPAYTSGSLDGAASRDGSVTVTSVSEDAVIAVSQGNAGSNQLTWAFRSIGLGAGDTPIDVVITRGATTVYTDNTGAKVGRDGFTKSYTVTINETGIPGETYTVTMSRH